MPSGHGEDSPRCGDRSRSVLSWPASVVSAYNIHLSGHLGDSVQCVECRSRSGPVVSSRPSLANKAVVPQPKNRRLSHAPGPARTPPSSPLILGVKRRFECRAGSFSQQQIPRYPERAAKFLADQRTKNLQAMVDAYRAGTTQEERERKIGRVMVKAHSPTEHGYNRDEEVLEEYRNALTEGSGRVATSKEESGDIDRAVYRG